MSTAACVALRVADCEQLAAARGWKVVERYVDSDISAYSGRRRPEYERMMEEIEAGLVEAVIVYHADRLHRHPRSWRCSSICASGAGRSWRR